MMELNSQKRPVGRPRLNPQADEPSGRLGFVADPELRAKLRQAADKANRSLSAETRHRVELTLALEEHDNPVVQRLDRIIEIMLKHEDTLDELSNRITAAQQKSDAIQLELDAINRRLLNLHVPVMQ